MISELLKEYLNLLLKDYKNKGIERLAVLSGKILYIFISIILISIILQFTGFGLVFLIGQLTGNILWGFFSITILFIAIMIIVYLHRDKLFFHKFVRWYKEFF